MSIFKISEVDCDGRNPKTICYVKAKTKEKAYAKAGIKSPTGYTPIIKLTKEEADKIIDKYKEDLALINIKIASMELYQEKNKSPLVFKLLDFNRNQLIKIKKFYLFKKDK